MYASKFALAPTRHTTATNTHTHTCSTYYVFPSSGPPRLLLLLLQMMMMCLPAASRARSLLNSPQTNVIFLCATARVYICMYKEFFLWSVIACKACRTLLFIIRSLMNSFLIKSLLFKFIFFCCRCCCCQLLVPEQRLRWRTAAACQAKRYPMRCR